MEEERLVLKDTKYLEAIASRIGLSPDSKLVTILGSFDKHAVDEIISYLTVQAQFFRNSEYDLSQDTLVGIISALNNDVFADHIQTKEDFYHYADIVIEMTKLHVILDRNGKPTNENIKNGRAIWNYELEETVNAIASLLRGNFDRDLSTMLQMLRDYQGLEESKNAIQTLLDYSPLISSSKDLECFGQFIKRISKFNFNSYAFLSSTVGYLLGGEDLWHEIIHGNIELQDVLTIGESSFMYGFRGKDFEELLEAYKQSEQKEAIDLSQIFVKKQIPLQFVFQNLSLLRNCDFSKDGLSIFTSFEAQKEFLEYCIQVCIERQLGSENISKFFNEALASEVEFVSKSRYNFGKIKGLPREELDVIQEDVEEERGLDRVMTKPNEELRAFAKKHLQSVLSKLCDEENYDAIASIKELINESAKIITALDRAQASKLSTDNILEYIQSLGDTKEEVLFPLTSRKKREMIFANLSKNEKLSFNFVQNLYYYFKQPWVAEFVTEAIKHTSVAYEFIKMVEKNLSKWVNEAWVANALKMIFSNLSKNENLSFSFVRNLDSYYKYPWVAESVTEAIKHTSVAYEFIKMVEKNLSKWVNEAWVANALKNAQSIFVKNIYINKGFEVTDPYREHRWLFGEKQIHITSALIDLMSGEINSRRLKELGIDVDEISPLLKEADKIIVSTYQYFLEQIRQCQYIGDQEKQSLLNPELSTVRMTPLLDNVRAYVARYFVQSVEGDVTRLSEIRNLINNLKGILQEGFKCYIRVHEIDVPLYDKLYAEFDTMRESGRYPLEVYLGRDGIYMYIGRRTQDIARRRKMGLWERNRLRENGEVVAIHPKYIVYPRLFKLEIKPEVLQKFLQQERFTLDRDPFCVDTGYTGTIPENIMDIMGFERDEMEERIRLLSTTKPNRRVRGISENVRPEIIQIENYAKLELSAEGLIVGKDGRIHHIAKPTEPEEQFYFMMIKQAIERHYWLKETLDYEPSEYVNLDYIDHTIRIRRDYERRLPQEFRDDPIEFFAEHSELMKGSKGEGEYQDEKIISFKLNDGTEVVVEKIELLKSKEARKEFAILIAAKKAGLPTAEPVGFLSGKKDSDGSYLMMKKLEGRSGRNFEKELRESGKYSDEQITDIMKQVAQKNRDMATLYRTKLSIDKPWRIIDTIIIFNEETNVVESVTPINFERAHTYNPSNPEQID